MQWEVGRQCNKILRGDWGDCLPLVALFFPRQFFVYPQLLFCLHPTVWTPGTGAKGRCQSCPWQSKLSTSSAPGGRTRSPKKYFRLLGPQFGLKIREGAQAPRPLPCIRHWHWRCHKQYIRDVDPYGCPWVLKLMMPKVEHGMWIQTGEGWMS